MVCGGGEEYDGKEDRSAFVRGVRIYWFLSISMDPGLNTTMLTREVYMHVVPHTVREDRR